jgi:imidazolonepropionase-like amidohydrolase
MPSQNRRTWSRSSFLLSGAGVVGLSGVASAQTKSVAISGVRLIDGTGAEPIDDAVIVIEDSHITAVGPRGTVVVPSGARVIAATGKSVMPALIDAHGHVGLLTGNTISTKHYSQASIRHDLQLFAAAGVLAVQVMGTDNDLAYEVRVAQGVRHANEARLLTAGRGFGTPGGIPGTGIAQWIYRPKTPAEARANVRELAATRPDLVKLWYDDNFGRSPKPSPVVASAIIDEAHQHGLRVAAHLFYLDDAKRLVAAGADIIAHSVRDREVDSELLDAMKAHGTKYIPTLALDESHYIYADRPAYTSEPLFRRVLAPGVFAYFNSDTYRDAIGNDRDTPKWRAAAAMGKRNAAIVYQAGIPVLLGTDSGAAVERVIGFDSHMELEFLVEGAKLSPLQAIHAGTGLNARELGARASDLGTLTPGKRANFLVLDGDPTVDIRNTRRIREIWQNGELAAGSYVALHEPNVAVFPAEEIFDPVHGHARSGCC